MKIFNDSKGYSLLELLVVIAIIAILAGISIPVFQGQVEKAKETADISNLRTAYELAITGHLVISTIHTERALDVIERLRDLGIADYLIKSALRGVISQRLLRRSRQST